MVGRALGIEVRLAVTDGHQPVGRGVGPALEARDALAVLQGRPEAPQDLRERALRLAADIIEMSGQAGAGSGLQVAQSRLDDGSAWRKFGEICEAQGGLREPPLASIRRQVESPGTGRIRAIDNRLLARVAKLAGAPKTPSAGLELHVRTGDHVQRGQPLFTLHGEAQGELAYALEYVSAHPDILDIAADAS
jgi:thymidine phosphorylase